MSVFREKTNLKMYHLLHNCFLIVILLIFYYKMMYIQYIYVYYIHGIYIYIYIWGERE